MANLTVDDAARIMGVPANLLGAQLQRTVPNLEQDLATWLRFGLGPELERIEAALDRRRELFPAGAQTYPRFDTEDFVRGDVETEDAIAHQQVQDGRLLVDEWRAEKGCRRCRTAPASE
jgi:phage portal protein BeeE